MENAREIIRLNELFFGFNEEQKVLLKFLEDGNLIEKIDDKWIMRECETSLTFSEETVSKFEEYNLLMRVAKDSDKEIYRLRDKYVYATFDDPPIAIEAYTEKQADYVLNSIIKNRGHNIEGTTVYQMSFGVFRQLEEAKGDVFYSLIGRFYTFDNAFSHVYSLLFENKKDFVFEKDTACFFINPESKYQILLVNNKVKRDAEMYQEGFYGLPAGTLRVSDLVKI